MPLHAPAPLKVGLPAWAVWAVASWAAALPAAAAEVSLKQVLSIADEMAPTLVAAREDLRAAEAARRESEGAFDPSWRTRASWTPLGYYQTGRIDTVLQQPTDLYGLSGFAGWRLGGGNFASYDGKAATADLGELRAGLILPLVRDRAIDKRRAERAAGQLEPEVAQAGLAQARLELRRAASLRYWNWVEAGVQLQIGQRLLAMAEHRDAGMAERVKRGDIAEIERQDLRRTVLSRQGQVVTAGQRLQGAALELSLYLRDPEGRPQSPDPGQLPNQAPGLGEGPPAVDEARRAALKRRPDVHRMAVWVRQQQTLAEQADNARLPALDLQAMVARDLGSGPASLRPLEFEVGLMLDVPLLNRVPQAKSLAARAKVGKLQAQEQWLRERVAVEIGQVHAELQAAAARVALAVQELALARKLAEAERSAFDAGATTVLVLNLREQAESEAELRHATAQIDWRRAWAGWEAVTAAE